MGYMDDFNATLEFLNLRDTFNFSMEEFMLVSQEYQADNRWFSKEVEYSIIFCFAVLICIGIISNGLLFYVIIRKGCRQSSRNWYILNLAGSDILTCAVCKPLTVVRLVMKDWVLGETMCKLAPTLQTVYVLVSTFTLVALAVDRYSAIMYNKHQTHVRRSVFICLSLIWTVSICMSVPMVVVHEIEHVKGFNGSVLYSLCIEKWGSESTSRVYNILMLLFQYLSPLISIVVLHLLIGRFLQSRFHSSSASDVSIRRKRRRHRKNILLLSTIAISFGVVWFPLHFVNALATVNYSFFKGVNFPLLYAIFMMLAFSSVCLNPVIYGLLNTNFQRDLIMICGVQKQRFSFYTDYTRRSSPNLEQLGLISCTPNELGISNGNLCRIKNDNCVSAM